jgi:hypothetical protein
MSRASVRAFLLYSDAAWVGPASSAHLSYREHGKVEEGFMPPTSPLAIRKPDCRDWSPMRAWRGLIPKSREANTYHAYTCLHWQAMLLFIHLW